MLDLNSSINSNCNIFLNTKGYQYHYIVKKGGVSFLIPRTHFEVFNQDLKQDRLSIIYKDKDIFYISGEIDNIKVYEDVYRFENYFEFKIHSKFIKMDQNDVRDFRIQQVLT
jgi:hypothetical protein